MTNVLSFFYILITITIIIVIVIIVVVAVACTITFVILICQMQRLICLSLIFVIFTSFSVNVFCCQISIFIWLC